MKSIIQRIRNMARNAGYDIVKYRPIGALLAQHKIDLVVDIGANDGGYASEIRSAGWGGQIISIEPQPKPFTRISQRFGGDPLWKGINIGLGSKDANLKMNLYEMDVLSSFLEKLEGSPAIDQIDVPVKRMDSYWQEVIGEKNNPFVKIDTQGFEMEIIEGFGDKVSHVIGWQLELSIKPLYEKQPAMEEVIAKLKSMGYSLWKVLPGLRDPVTHQAYEFDGIFFKNE